MKKGRLKKPRNFSEKLSLKLRRRSVTFASTTLFEPAKKISRKKKSATLT